MKTYFQLQIKLLNRKMIDFGVPLLVGYPLLIYAFILFSSYFFEKAVFAQYIFILFALGFIFRLSEPKRNDFLKSIFNKEKYRWLRVLENLILCMPFTVFLLYQKQFWICLLLCFLAVCFALIGFATTLNITIPTPFSKRPYEFTVGFRKTFYMFPIAYFLTYISVWVENFNLGIFSLLLIGLICFWYYSKVENDYFVWIFNVSSETFLIKKTTTCFIYFTFLSLPIVLVLVISFFSQVDIVLILYALCYIYLGTIIFAKYSVYPKQMNISQGIIIAISFMFPLILVVVTPYFYSLSLKRLKPILDDKN